MYSLLLRLADSDYDDVVATLWELGTLGIIEYSETIRAFFETDQEAHGAAHRFEQILIQIEQEPTLLANAANPDGWDPLLIGERFFIAPSSLNAATPPGRFRLTIDAQSAFGSGRHESTQLMVQALETYLKPGMTVLDAGCGSGILSAAAHLLSAAHVLACDIDPNAMSVARQLSGFELFAGSADAVRTHAADLVLANISARVVDVLAPDLNRVAKPDGLIIISGFLRDHPPRRFRPTAILELSEWQCWICKPDPALAQERAEPTPHALKWW